MVEPKDCVVKVPMTATQYWALHHAAHVNQVGMASLMRMALSRYLKALLTEDQRERAECGHVMAMPDEGDHP